MEEGNMLQIISSPEQIHELFRVFTELRKLAAAGHFADNQAFAIESPVDGEIGIACLMSSANEKFSVCVFRGTDAYAQYCYAEKCEFLGEPEDVLVQIPQLYASFEDLAGLDEEDLTIVHLLGLPMKNGRKLPVFRSYHPVSGLLKPTSDEILLLYYSMQQTVCVLEAIRDKQISLPTAANELLFRKITDSVEFPQWETTSLLIPMGDSETAYLPEASVLQDLRALPRKKISLEIDVFALNPSVPDGQQSLAYIVVDGTSEMVVDYMMMPVESNHMRIREKIFGKMVSSAQRLGYLPESIFVHGHSLYNLFLPLTRELGIRLEFVYELPSASEVRTSMGGSRLSYGLQDSFQFCFGF